MKFFYRYECLEEIEMREEEGGRRISPFLTTSRGDDGILPNPEESADPVADLSITLQLGILPSLLSF